VFNLIRILLVVFGATGVVVGVTRIRNPAWRTTGWWKDHKALGLALTGPPFLGPRRLRADPLQPSLERFAGVIQVVVGTFLFIGGVIAVLVGSK
jgi:hypothetical protein